MTTAGDITSTVAVEPFRWVNHQPERDMPPGFKAFARALGTDLTTASVRSIITVLGLILRDAMFRQSKESSTRWILFKTFAQIFVVWTLILIVFPYLIIILEDKLGVPRFAFPFQKTIAVVFFVGISFIGLSSAYTMSRVGRGTPLPLDAATKLVISGFYAYVRNPMAISGIGQGLAVALFLGSPLVAVYALMGAFIWQFVFRPLEEEDLQKHFGAEYENYRRQIRCWIPRRRRYQIESTAASSNSIQSPSGKM